MKKKKKLNNDFKIILRASGIAFLLFFIAFIFVPFVHKTYQETCSPVYGQVLEIKSSSAGGLFHSDEYVYKTSIGDVASSYRYEIGDMIYVKDNC